MKSLGNIFVLLSRNITCWGSSALRMLTEGKFDAVALQETHQMEGRESTDVVSQMFEKGWRAVASPAVRTAQTERAGGVVVATRRHAAVTSFRHLAMRQGQAYGMRDLDNKNFTAGPIDFDGFAAMSIRFKRVTLVVISVYLQPTIGVKGQNLRRLAMLAALLKSVRGAWVAVGDWNATPDELRASKWDQSVQGTIITPDNTEYTCTAGQGRLIDFAVVSSSALPMLKKCDAIDDGQWKSHYAIRLQWNFGFRSNGGQNVGATKSLHTCSTAQEESRP